MSILYPPESLVVNPTSRKTVNLYSRLFSGFHDDEHVLHALDKSLHLTSFTKSDIHRRVLALVGRIEYATSPLTLNRQPRILIVASASECSFVSMSASAFMAAHHCICFDTLSPESLSQRIDIFQPDVVICLSSNRPLAESALSLSSLTLPIILYDTISFSASSNANSPNPNSFTPDDSLFTLFTSGSTSRPKAVTHNPFSYVDFAIHTCSLYFSLTKGCTMFTATDAAWINGHTYAYYGPLCIGSATVLCENLVALASIRNLAPVLQSTSTSVFYASVTLLRLLKSSASKYATLAELGYDNINLVHVGSCGEPLADSVGAWAVKFFQPIYPYIVNTYFQTETGGILTAPLPHAYSPDHSSVGMPHSQLPISLASHIYDTHYLSEHNLSPNELVVPCRWDGLFQHLSGDNVGTYFTPDGHFRLHDVGHYDSSGYLFVDGRSDDVMNIYGHRISSGEVESVLLSLPFIHEACSVSIPDPVTGQKHVIFATFIHHLKPDDPTAVINSLLTQSLTPFHKAQSVFSFDNLPKTKSGKIMRRLMRILLDDMHALASLDLSTLSNKDLFFSSCRSFLPPS